MCGRPQPQVLLEAAACVPDATALTPIPNPNLNAHQVRSPQMTSRLDDMDGMGSMDQASLDGNGGAPAYSPLPGAASTLADEVQRRQQHARTAPLGQQPPRPANSFKRSSAARTPAGMLGALAPPGPRGARREL